MPGLENEEDSFWLIKRIDIFKKKNGRAINNDFINIRFFRFCTFLSAQQSQADGAISRRLGGTNALI